MKKTKRMSAAVMSAVMLGAFFAVPNTAYAETDTAVPFTVSIDAPNLTEGVFAVIFKNDYSRETVENVLIPELKGNNEVKDIRFFKTYYNADNFYTTDTSVYKTDYITRDVYVVELESDDKETACAVETAFSETGYFHYIDAVNFFGAQSAFTAPDEEELPFTAKPEDNFIANKLSVMFKGRYSQEELENGIIPELKKIDGVKQFEYMSTGERGRALYIIELDFDRDDKAAAYDTAKALYDTGYFYSVEMNMLPIAASDNVKGDANCDGNVNMSDAVLIMQSIANPSKYILTEQGRENADMDGDGVTNADALAIQKKLLKLEE